MYKLFRTEARIVSYFWGDDEDDNEYLAKESLIAEVSNRENIIEVDNIEEVHDDMYIEEHWVDGIPYGSIDDQRTVGEIIASGDFGYSLDEDPDLNIEEYVHESEYVDDTFVDPDDQDDDVWKEEL